MPLSPETLTLGPWSKEDDTKLELGTELPFQLSREAVHSALDQRASVCTLVLTVIQLLGCNPPRGVSEHSSCKHDIQLESFCQ